MLNRLLSTEPPVCPRWDSLRRISRIFAQDEDNTDSTYRKYLTLLCQKAAEPGPSISDIFNPESRIGNYDSHGNDFEHDIITAAVYANKLQFIDHLGYRTSYTDIRLGTFYPVFLSAIKENNHLAVDLLLTKRRHARPSFPLARLNIPAETYQYLELASRYSDLAMVKKFLPFWFDEEVQYAEDEDEPFFRTLKDILRTPSVAIFEWLRGLKQHDPPLDLPAPALAALLSHACASGWSEMVSHLLHLGAPVAGPEDLWTSYGCPPLTAACVNGHIVIARLLLQHSAEIPPDVLAKTARRRHWRIIWMLVDEFGADVGGAQGAAAMVCAIEQEREDLVSGIWERGARLTGERARMAVEVVEEQGLDSMRGFLMGMEGVLASVSLRA
jgi:hypothetical protein